MRVYPGASARVKPERTSTPKKSQKIRVTAFATLALMPDPHFLDSPLAKLAMIVIASFASAQGRWLASDAAPVRPADRARCLEIAERLVMAEGGEK